MYLIIGGAGYIGSHIVKRMYEEGRQFIVLDDLSTGHLEALQAIENNADHFGGKIVFIKGNAGDMSLLRQLFMDYPIKAVIHLAACSLVGESMQKPGKYFLNNVSNTVSLLECMMEYNIKQIVFSSTAAVYGEPEIIPILEDVETRPANVYGASKLMVENILEWYGRIYGLRYVVLRYFNAAGADPSAVIGEDHKNETHLIPILARAALGLIPCFSLFGDDYATADGTCVRDYIHVNDLASAHLLAVDALNDGRSSRIYNLGNNQGYSVREVLNAMEQVSGVSIPCAVLERRAGDPAILVASSEKIKQELGWRPVHTDIYDIVGTAWEWHRKHPQGYDARD